MGRKAEDPDHIRRAQAFGGNLREVRHRRMLSQEALSYEADVDRSAISNYEQGIREPNLSTIVKLAEALEVPAGDLVRGL